jgi:lycopene cyclase domain-containing protein
MTYLQFLGVFIAPLLLLTGLLAHRAHRSSVSDARLWPVGLAVLGLLWAAAWVWTTPWDSWIIRNGVWSYPQGRVIATLFRVPLEEYLFMALQTLIVGLWTLYRISRTEPALCAPLSASGGRLRIVWGTAWVIAAAAGAVLVQWQQGTYLGSMLLWFGPLIAVQNLVGADVLRACRTERLTSLLVPVFYLWMADRIAIGLNVWHISTTRTYGIKLLGLPLEEALFFLITSMLLVNGLILATHRRIQQRIRRPSTVRPARERVTP